GAPITSLLYNLYALQLDEYMGDIRGGFYARYGDDFLFAHEKTDVFQEAIEESDRILTRLLLKKNLAKTKCIFFNAAGRSQNGFVGSTVIEYLGMQLHFDGTAALKKQKVAEVLQDLKARLRVTIKQLRNRSLDEQGKFSCEVINKALD